MRPRLLQLQPLGRSNSVAIVDVTDLPRESDSGVSEGGSAVSRPALLGLMSELIAKTEPKPKAIGVDVDFSPDDNGNPITARDYAFFRDCLAVSRASGVPIFLGVHRHAGDRPNKWLGSPEAAELAAGIAVGNVA